MSEELREKVARAIAEALGDDLDHAFVNKSEWNAARGEKGGRYRDINEPMREEYLAAAHDALNLIGGDGWKPIETFDPPEDGEPRVEVMLAWTNIRDGVETSAVGEAYWNRESADWWWANTSPGDYYSDTVQNSITGRITHWRPLPPPPPVTP